MSENKIKQQINNVANDNLEALKQLFPSAVKDGQVDFEALKEELGEFEEVKDEKYEFRWAGKQNAKKAAQTDVGNRTLKYIPEDSKDADTTQNLYIEGDNLEVLKLLRQNYYGAIKMIYIDPPYNTGNDFIYNDNFSMSKEESEKVENRLSEDGERLQKNPKEGNSKYHTKWLNMMYPRLKVARDLLTDDGVIFISIDDNEQANLKKICDEIFGGNNKVAILPTIMNLKGNQDEFAFAGTHEYTVVYSKKYDDLNISSLKVDEEEVILEWQEDEEGYYKKGASLISTGQNAPRELRPNLWFPILYKEDKLYLPSEEFVNLLFDEKTKLFNDILLKEYIEKKEKKVMLLSYLC